jgi:two-component system KDP operon response regulator KdpE
MKKTLLIVEDDLDLNKMIGLTLQRRGFDVLSASCGRQALQIAYEAHPDLVVLDVMMPEMDGFQICERLREMSDVPIVFLTARAEEEDLVHGFLLGADDYVKKPFSLTELEMRIRAVLSRASHEKSAVTKLYNDGVLKIDLERQHVFRHRKMVHLTPTEFRLLGSLVRRQGSVVAHKDLLGEVWGEGYLDATACLSLYIRYLREKIEEDPGDPQYIRTKWGMGYWFEPMVGLS